MQKQLNRILSIGLPHTRPKTTALIIIWSRDTGLLTGIL